MTEYFMAFVVAALFCWPFVTAYRRKTRMCQMNIDWYLEKGCICAVTIAHVVALLCITHLSAKGRMTSYQNELQILIAELQTAVVRCETSQRFRLKPDFQRDFDEFEKLFNFASEVFDQREDLSQQFSFMKKQMFA
eukprot:gene55477-76007_t